MSTMLGPRPQEPLSCLNRKMGRQRDDIELRTWKDIDGCSWHETSPRAASSSTPGRYLMRPYFCSNPDSAITFSTAAMLRGTKSDVIWAPDSVITIMSSSRM